MKNLTLILPVLLMFSFLRSHGQVLVDSIPYPGMLNLAFWGIHVTPDTIFLGADGPGDIYFSDHDGNIIGQLPTGYTYNHGLIKRESSYLIAKNYTASGALLHEIDLAGNFINEYVFPPGITGNSAGVGDLAEAGEGAIWFTVYHPWSQTYPYTYAYKWIPGTSTFLDTVPLQGRQPYGITVKGDTLFYVIDNIHGDQERIYAYDLTNEEDLYWIELPDTPIDNDQRPFGLHYDGEHLYLVANRQGGSAFAHQTIFIYSFDITTGIDTRRYVKEVNIYPNPASNHIWVESPAVPGPNSSIQIFNSQGSLVHQQRADGIIQRIDTHRFQAGLYVVRYSEGNNILASQRISIVR